MKKSLINSAVFVFGVAAIIASYGANQLPFYVLKPLTTILIICIPVLCMKNGLSNGGQFRAMLLSALLFCLTGDILLLNESYFAYGLGAFLIAHIIFAVIFYKLANGRLYSLPLIVLLVVSAAYFAIIKSALGALTIPVALYFCFIVVMCWQSCRVALSRGDRWGYGIAVAATLFVVSDALIAANKFISEFDAANALILGLYWLSITIMANLFSGGSNTMARP